MGRRVWEHGNLAQKNLTVLWLPLGELILIPFLVHGIGLPAHFELHRPDRLSGLEASIVPRRPPTFRSRAVSPVVEAHRNETRFDDTRATPFDQLEVSRLTVPLPRGSAVLGLALHAPREVEVGTCGVIDLVQRDGKGRVVGGITIEVEVVDGQPKEAG